MKLSVAAVALGLLSLVSAGRSPQHVGKKFPQHKRSAIPHAQPAQPQLETRAAPHQFLNSATKSTFFAKTWRKRWLTWYRICGERYGASRRRLRCRRVILRSPAHLQQDARARALLLVLPINKSKSQERDCDMVEWWSRMQFLGRIPAR